MPVLTVDALLKMALFTTQMLTSPNYSGVAQDLLVYQYYVNECAFAIKGLANAIGEWDRARATGLCEYRRDLWNSYLAVVNRSIGPKVGDEFEMIA